MKKTNIAWATGFFDGEGTIRAQPSGRPRKDGTQYKTLCISITQAGPFAIEMLEKFTLTLGIHNKIKSRKISTLGKLPIWYVSTTGKTARRVINLMKPYMCGKKLHDLNLAENKLTEEFVDARFK